MMSVMSKPCKSITKKNEAIAVKYSTLSHIQQNASFYKEIIYLQEKIARKYTELDILSND